MKKYVPKRLNVSGQLISNSKWNCEEKKGYNKITFSFPGELKNFFWFPKGIEILLIKIYYSQLQGWCWLGGGGMAGVLLKGGRYGVRALGGSITGGGSSFGMGAGW